MFVSNRRRDSNRDLIESRIDFAHHCISLQLLASGVVFKTAVLMWKRVYGVTRAYLQNSACSRSSSVVRDAS